MGTNLEATQQLELDVAETITVWVAAGITPFEAWVAMEGPVCMKAPLWDDVMCLARSRAWFMVAQDAA